jgi:hypothetical protein
MYYGNRTVNAFQLVLAGGDANLDCFITLKTYKFCDATQQLSLCTSLFMLTTQALISRVLVPGMSNFINASVRRLLFFFCARLRQRAVAAARPCCESCGARVRHQLQVLHSGSDDGAGETSGIVALGSRDEERSKQVAMIGAA